MKTITKKNILALKKRLEQMDLSSDLTDFVSITIPTKKWEKIWDDFMKEKKC